MKKFLSKFLAVATIVTIMPTATTLAFGSMPATVLSGSVSSGNTVNLSWSAPDNNNYNYIYNFYQGYAVLMNNQPIALLKFANNNYSYYNFNGLKNGIYNFTVDLYYYDVNGIHYTNPSNSVRLRIDNSNNGYGTPPPNNTAKAITLNVDDSGNNVVLDWSPYGGNFDGYIIKLTEVDQNHSELPYTTIFYNLSKYSTSFNSLNVASGHQYDVQVLPYKGSFNYVNGAASNKKFINLASNNIELSAQFTGRKIEGYFTSDNNQQVDGYAVYVLSGLQGDSSMANASPMFLSKYQNSFTVYPSTTGYYTLKVYAYNELPDGTRVYHQPGSNLVTVRY